jgi:hypothetical protein
METKFDDPTFVSVAPPPIPSAPLPPAPAADEIREYEIKKLYHDITDGLEKKNNCKFSPSLASMIWIFLSQWATTTP